MIEDKKQGRKTAGNPFLPIYFVRQNRQRSIRLILMFMLTYLVYLGGLYITNIEAYFGYSIDDLRNFVILEPNSSDDDWEEYEKAIEEISKDSRVTVMQSGISSRLITKTIMGFTNDYPQYAFQSVDDFRVFCDFLGIKCDFDSLKEGSMIASELFAANRGIKIGDKPIEGKDDSIFGDLTLDAITDEKGYSVYYINNDGINMSHKVLATGMTLSEFEDWKTEVLNQYDIEMIDGDYLEDRIHSQLQGVYSIYMFIVMMLAIVMAVTINAAFVGLYQHRQPEFAVYRAIGIPKGSIIRKVVGEILTIDMLGIFFGGIVTFIFLYLFNNLYLLGRGFRLFYYNRLSFLAMLVCNVLVILPLMFTRCRRTLKADICEY